MKYTPPSAAVTSRGQRRLVWLNIAVQVAFPVAVAFTPVMAGAGEQRFLQQTGPLSAQRIQVYTLCAGENVTTVAQKFHITVQQLRELNQFRTFAHGFEHLQPGDECDVPFAPLPEVHWDEAPSIGTPQDQNNDTARKVAGYASQAGSFLSNSPNGDAAASMARSMATGEASGAVQQWLGQFGTARVQLDADKNLSLKNSQFDLLVPLYDQGKMLAFTQSSLHRTDGRTQANLGAGLRHFSDHSMLGSNLFGDYDLSRDHARMGAGVEYWRDFMKLSANGYLRLTGWKDAPELADYQARPANGWDMRAQAWLPSLPQLGGKLTYEQYYGKEVALFGVDSRQKNPHVITAGVSYTPVPLITLGAEHRQGQSGKSDARLTLDVNYMLCVPWHKQVNPDTVAALRSLAGSRYDLVERNNNIVLEYRQKETIRLKTSTLISGYPGEQKSLDVSVTSSHGLSRVEWDASTLNAAGGKVVQEGGNYAIVLPAYRTDLQAVNTYTVSGVAVDTKGNRSNRSDTQVTVQAAAVSKQDSSFTPANSTLPADGKSLQLLTLTLKDERNQPVDLDVADVILENIVLKSATVSALIRKSAGIYTTTVTAGTDVEDITLTPTVNGVTLTPIKVAITSVAPDADKSVFTASSETMVADNSTTSTLTLVAKDAQGNALGGLKDKLAFVLMSGSGQPGIGGLTQSPVEESSTKGTYTATIKGGTAGQYVIVPEYNGSAVGSLSSTVTLTAGAIEQAHSTIALDKTRYESGAEMAVTIALKDSQDNAVLGAASSLT
ncbi:invasin, partial [Enterobacterales bacterium CwR94]